MSAVCCTMAFGARLPNESRTANCRKLKGRTWLIFTNRASTPTRMLQLMVTACEVAVVMIISSRLRVLGASLVNVFSSHSHHGATEATENIKSRGAYGYTAQAKTQ